MVLSALGAGEVTRRWFLQLDSGSGWKREIEENLPEIVGLELKIHSDMPDWWSDFLNLGGRLGSDKFRDIFPDIIFLGWTNIITTVTIPQESF